MREETTDLQIRGIPIQLREKLRRRATAEGRSMSQYVIDLLEKDTSRMTMQEWHDAVRRDIPARELPRPVADYIREERQSDENSDE